MKISFSTEKATQLKADTLVAGLSKGEKLEANPRLRAVDKALGGALTQAIRVEKFEGKADQVLKLAGNSRLKVGRIVLVGLGSKEATVARQRRLGVRAARAASGTGHLALLLDTHDASTVEAVTDGIVTGSYQLSRYLSKKKAGTKLSRATLALTKKPADELKRSVSVGTVVGEAVNFARDLVNAPANHLSPTVLAQAAVHASKQVGITCSVWDKKRIQKEGMELLLAVSRGSDEEPRFIHMSYKPVKATKRVVFVGKGVTFDAGGLCIKPSGSMYNMKCDMAGSAVTIATVAAAAALKIPVEIHGIVAATENLLGGSAYRPGDVFKSYDGKTVEIVNTDAEGRLALADALAYARELKPDYMVDHATLTGACMVALGSYTAGLFSNDSDLRELYQKSAQTQGEAYWHMPLSESQRPGLKSTIADLKHTGETYGGAISAALFLREFVGKTRWAHVDIAGPSFLEREHGIYPKGGTGFGVLTALRFLRSVADS